MMREYQEQLCKEFDRQIDNLIHKGYAKIARLSTSDWVKRVEPLKERIADIPKKAKVDRIPFVIVVKQDCLPADKAITLVELKGKSGFTEMEPGDIRGFEPLKGITIPGGMAYLLVDIDTGKATLDVTPEDALRRIKRAKRTPLTIDEGVALVTHYPEILKTKNCFYMLGSRGDDRRVTALWISSGRPRLGWCWAGNPHSWLGSASGAMRLGLES